MTYPEAIAFLYDLRLFGMKLGLDNMRRLAALAGNPQDRLRFIHVAGTNGKGSTCAMLESIYRAAGLRVGLFTSPHLVSFSERIQINRQPVTEADVVRLVQEAQELLETFSEGTHPTFFEVVTLMALNYFARQGCDMVIWETGLGGRLDATNIVSPLASIITNVQCDHQQWLGQTLAEIAAEKAGIIKPGVPVITGAEDPSALAVIAGKAGECHAPLTVVSQAEAARLHETELSLRGEHQKMNAAVALAAARILQPLFPLKSQDISRGLKQTQWPGRFQLIQRGPQTLLLDGAHNIDGARTVAVALAHYFPGARPALILGIMRDKDWAGICRILSPAASRFLLCPVSSDRTADPGQLAVNCHATNLQAPVACCENVAQALDAARDERLVVVTGSIHFVGEAMEALGLAAPSPERALNEWTVTKR